MLLRAGGINMATASKIVDATFLQRAQQEDEPFVKQGYPPRLVGALHTRGWILARLPVLDTSKVRDPDTVPVFMMPSGKAGKSSVARFDYEDGRFGLAFWVEGLKGEDVIFSDGSKKQGRFIDGMVTVYKTGTEDSPWTFRARCDRYNTQSGRTLEEQIITAYQQFHKAVHQGARDGVERDFCDTCPPLLRGGHGGALRFAEAVISGKDVNFGIVDPQTVAQLDTAAQIPPKVEEAKEDPPLLPEPEEEQPVVPGAVPERSWLSRVGSCICDFFRWLCCWCCENREDEYGAY